MKNPQARLKQQACCTLKALAAETTVPEVKKQCAEAIRHYEKNDNVAGENKIKEFLPNILLDEKNRNRHLIKVYKLLAVLNVMAFSYNESIKYYDRVLALDNKDAQAYGERAFCKKETNDFAGALADYDKALTLNPTNYNNCLERGMIKSFLDQDGAAIMDFNRALRLNENSADVYLNLGLSYEKLGMNAIALKNYNLGLRRAPRNKGLLAQAAQLFSVGTAALPKINDGAAGYGASL